MSFQRERATSFTGASFIGITGLIVAAALRDSKPVTAGDIATGFHDFKDFVEKKC